MAYGSYAELSAQAPAKFERKATADALRVGLERVAPPGRAPRSSIVERYGKNIIGKGQVWLREWTERMFG